MKMIPMLALSFLVSAGSATMVNAADTPVTREELGGLIRQYLLDHPDVIIEAVDKFQKNQQEAGLEEARAAIKANQDAIYHHPGIPSVGDKKAPVTIVEFFDYNCSACKYMFKAIDEVIKGGLKDVRILFFEFPIFGEQSENLARIGLAVYAIAPDKYVDFHRHMMEFKGSATAEEAYNFAAKIGVAREAVEKELSKPTYTALSKEIAELGEKLKIRGTPFLIIGEEPVPHALDAAGLKEYIAKAKAK